MSFYVQVRKNAMYNTNGLNTRGITVQTNSKAPAKTAKIGPFAGAAPKYGPKCDECGRKLPVRG